MKKERDKTDLIAIRRNFDFFMTDCDFELYKEVYDLGWTVFYKGKALAIEVGIVMYDLGIFVRFYLLEHGRIPDYPLNVKRGDKLTVFYFSDVLAIRSGEDFGYLYSEDPDAREMILRNLASRVRQYAPDLLAEDLSIVPQIEEIVWTRADANAASR